MTSTKKELHPASIVGREGETLYFRKYSTLHFFSQKKNIFYKCATYENLHAEIADYVVYPKALRGKLIEDWIQAAEIATDDKLSGWNIYNWHKKKRKKSVRK